MIVNVTMVVAVLTFVNSVYAGGGDLGLRKDIAEQNVDGRFKPGSHVKVFLPNLPYIAISHSINAGLVRPANNKKGWEYNLAVSHQRIADNIYDFELRRGVKFQDGTNFDADSVVMNMKYFKKEPFTFTKIHEVFDRVEKLSKYKVRFHLTKRHGVFLYDALWIHFYTRAYLEQYGWNGKSTCPNLAAPGPYGIGPYILTKGYIEGDRNSSVAELTANPYYWNSSYPKVEKFTIYTDLKVEDAIVKTLYEEGGMDIMPIPFEYELPTVLSPYAKLMTIESSNNYSVHFNMVNGNSLIAEREVREAINKSIDQESLLNLSMNGEGELSPTAMSLNFYGAREALKSLKPHSSIDNPLSESVKEELMGIIKKNQLKYGMNPEKKLKLRIITQESFLFLIRDIQYFLNQIHVDLEVDVVKAEKDVFRQLHRTAVGKNDKNWDLLIWGNFDWYKHPWTVFLTYRSGDPWSTIMRDDHLEKDLSLLFETSVDEEGYRPLLKSIVSHVYDQSYMLFLPSPNKVVAVNKEVVFKPRKSALMPLWEIEVTDLHWSVRKGNYPDELKNPVTIGDFSKRGR